MFGTGFGTAYPVFAAHVMRQVSPLRRGAAFGGILAAFDTGIGTGSIGMGWIRRTYGFAAAFATAAALAALLVPYFLSAERGCSSSGRRRDRPTPAARGGRDPLVPESPSDYSRCGRSVGQTFGTTERMEGAMDTDSTDVAANRTKSADAERNLASIRPSFIVKDCPDVLPAPRLKGTGSWSMRGRRSTVTIRAIAPAAAALLAVGCDTINYREDEILRSRSGVAGVSRVGGARFRR